MPRLITAGIESLFPLADIMRLFYGSVHEDEKGNIIAGSRDPEIKSSCLKSGSNSYIISTCTGNVFLQQKVEATEVRREGKRQLYQVLSRLTGIKWPWGSLTGIRPTQIAARCLLEEKTWERAYHKLVDYWLVSPQRAELALQTARMETNLLHKVPTADVCVYVGIPFCPSRCAYCSFISHDRKNQLQQLSSYVEAVIREAQEIFPGGSEKISCLYIGGGTPTCLNEKQLQTLCQSLHDVLDTSKIKEITVEAGRPDTITPEKLRILSSAGFDRICINPQTFHDRTLRAIGRHHNTSDTVGAVEMVRQAGFPVLNMDLIAGLPGESTEDFLTSLRTTLTFEPENITIHSLALKRGAHMLDERTKDMKGLRPDPDLAQMLLRAYDLLGAKQYRPYYLYRQKNSVGGLENVGFSRPGHECLYNVAMMSDLRPVIGLGAGSMSKWNFTTGTKRIANPRDISLYIEKASILGNKKREIMSGFSGCRGSG